MRNLSALSSDVECLKKKREDKFNCVSNCFSWARAVNADGRRWSWWCVVDWRQSNCPVLVARRRDCGGTLLVAVRARTALEEARQSDNCTANEEAAGNAAGNAADQRRVDRGWRLVVDVVRVHKGRCCRRVWRTTRR